MWADTPEARYWSLNRLRAVPVERMLKHIFSDAILSNVSSDSEIMAAFGAGADTSGGRYIEIGHYFALAPNGPDGQPLRYLPSDAPKPSASGRTIVKVLR